MSDHEQSAGIVIGKVTKVDDPEGLGRIQVTYPWLSGPEERWVSVAAPMAGADAGIFCMPDEDDEVILAFDHGQLDHPYVIGFLWNAQQKPPSTDHRQRMIRSKNGHTIRFIDSTPTAGNSGGVVIEDNHGNTIVMTNGRVSIHSVGLLDFSAAMMTLQGRLVRPVGPAI